LTFQQLTKERKRRQAAASNLFASSGGSHSGKKGCSTPNSIYNYSEIRRKACRKKSFLIFPVPGRDVTYQTLPGCNNDIVYKLFPPRESLVSDIPAGDGNIEELFLRCGERQRVKKE
jgi:hypothetical protein